MTQHSESDEDRRAVLATYEAMRSPLSPEMLARVRGEVTAEEGQGASAVAEGNVTSTPINTCGATRLGAHLYVCLLPIDHNHDHHDPTHNATWSDHSRVVTRRIT